MYIIKSVDYIYAALKNPKICANDKKKKIVTLSN